jgi:hypothetical protein
VNNDEARAPKQVSHRRAIRLLAGSALALLGAVALSAVAGPAWRITAQIVDNATTIRPAAAGDTVDLAQRIRRPDGLLLAQAPAAPAAPAARPRQSPDLSRQSAAEAAAKSAGCKTCHTQTDSDSMHTTDAVKLGCIDCHGGRNDVKLPAGVAKDSAQYNELKKQAHVQPKHLAMWRNAANPERVYTQWLEETYDFVKFVNPGDLRVARETCGGTGCHAAEVQQVQKSMMTTGPMLWQAALYNNGEYPIKIARYGESYSPDGVPQRVFTVPPPTAEEILKQGIVPFLEPLPRFEVQQPGNVLRIFERGQSKPFDLGIPSLDEPPGRPLNRLSQRGLGTLNRTDPVWLNLQRTRLLDPMLHLPGTNDHPGDYRASGCSACHVLYANDRSPVHSGPIAQFGNLGRTQTVDPTIPKDQSGHPIKHTFTNSIPSSQCVVCHHHPGTTVTNSYFGYTWWDNETDGELMYPAEDKKLTPEEVFKIQAHNPEGAALRGKWSDRSFLANITDLNPKLTRTQFADFHGHGWVFRGVYKQDRKGNMLDAEGKVVPPEDPDRFKKAVHLKDIHLERGMHCIDCHFKQDNHGNGKLYGEVRAAIEITCVDCHGTISSVATLKTSGPAAPPGGTDLTKLRTPFGKRRFEVDLGVVTQRSMVDEKLEWKVTQTIDSVDPNSEWGKANPKKVELSRLAKTLRKDGRTWGDAVPDAQLAHGDSRMSCQSCHTSWTTSCFGCHLPMKANERKPALHNEGDVQRNWTPYNFQTLRDDVYMLAIDGNAAKNRISPSRSTCAVLVGSQNANREWVYSQQQTVSAEGFSGHAFSTFVPHTVRATETKQCVDCHVSSANDNNAWMASLLMQGTNFYNFVGRYAYVAGGKAGLEAVTVTELEEPQAVIGSYLHKVAFPTNYKKHKTGGDRLTDTTHHRGRDVMDIFGRDEVLSIQVRGEYLYTANGPGGFRAYDVAQIDQKGFSERIVTAPFSPLGQRLYVKTKYATAVASPSTLAVDPARSRRPENQEQPIHPVYAYLYVSDKFEGLVVIGNPADSKNGPGVSTLLDGDPNNNFLERALAFNPNGILNGAVNLTIAGTYAYILADRGLVIVDLDDPLKPRVVGEVAAPNIVKPRSVAVQFRYAFVTDAEGLKVVDVTNPKAPRFVPGATVRMPDARGLYLARTYAYVAAGSQGLVIVDIERPERPAIDQTFNAGGAINDAHDVKLAMTNASLFAYIADGKNGLRVVQLTSPADVPTYLGFSPRPRPQLIATAKTKGPALAVSKGIDRDRAVDESGNQIAVFNRLGSRPFNLAEMQRMYLRNGELYTVSAEPPSTPRPPAKREEKKQEGEEDSGPRRRGR